MVAQVEVPGAHTVTVVNRKLGPEFTVRDATFGAGAAMVLPPLPPVPVGAPPDEAACDALLEPPLPQAAAIHKVPTSASDRMRPNFVDLSDFFAPPLIVS